jgi:hypothetical protein
MIPWFEEFVGIGVAHSISGGLAQGEIISLYIGRLITPGPEQP